MAKKKSGGKKKKRAAVKGKKGPKGTYVSGFIPFSIYGKRKSRKKK